MELELARMESLEWQGILYPELECLASHHLELGLGCRYHCQMELELECRWCYRLGSVRQWSCCMER